jgi:hypothetical protein
MSCKSQLDSLVSWSKTKKSADDAGAHPSSDLVDRRDSYRLHTKPVSSHFSWCWLTAEGELTASGLTEHFFVLSLDKYDLLALSIV